MLTNPHCETINKVLTDLRNARENLKTELEYATKAVDSEYNVMADSLILAVTEDAAATEVSHYIFHVENVEKAVEAVDYLIYVELCKQVANTAKIRLLMRTIKHLKHPELLEG